MNRRILVLIVMLLTSIVFVAIVQIYFSKIVEKNIQTEKDFIIRQTISSDLVNRIHALESSFYKTPLVSSRDILLEKRLGVLHNEISDIEKLISVFELGGEYHKKLPLNLTEESYFSNSITLHKSSEIPIEVFSLKPKIAQLHMMADRLNEMTNMKLKLQNEKKTIKSDFANKISLYSKSIESIFNRLIEDANHLYYDASKMRIQGSDRISKLKKRYNFVTIAAIFLTLMILMFILRYFFDELYDRIYKDNLTKLYSRTKLEESPFGKNALLILIDIDSFSDINSLYGMPFGDDVIVNLASRLHDFDPRADSYRVAGDVFGILYPSFNGNDIMVAEIVNKIRTKMVDCKKCHIEISVTMGIGRGLDCIHDAYTALDIANNKKESYWIYHDESNYIREIQFNRLWHDELKSALETDAIVPFFHPIVDKDKNVVHHETLMRLKRSNGKVEYISPSVFLDVAKTTKLYIPISQMLISKAFAFFAEKPGVSFAINLSYEDMEKESIYIFLMGLISKYDIGDRVIFEVLETSFIENPILFEEFIRLFRSKGVKFAIDDFGAGYSNLKRVVELNPDYLKIDGSLIQSMLSDKRSHKMVENIVEYAREFNIKTVAEFVSSPELFNECKRMNMDYCQGFYFAEPSPELQALG